MRTLLWAGLLVAAVIRVNASDEVVCATFASKTISNTEAFWRSDKRVPNLVPLPLESPSPAELGLEPRRSFWGHIQNFGSFIKKHFTVTIPTSHPEDAATNDAPFKTAGRLFFIDSQGTQRWCTAEFVDDDATLLTAAHCVWDRASTDFYRSIYFGRVYNNGFVENFSIASVGVLTEWIQTGAPHQYDFAFLSTTLPTTQGHLVSSATLPTDWIAIGYPRKFTVNGTTEYPNGEIMKRASGVAGVASQNMFLMLGNPMGRGTSGGAWSPPGQSPFGNEVFSIASMLGSSPDSIYGPMLYGSLLEKRTLQLAAFVKNGCKDSSQ